jgi:integrase
MNSEPEILPPRTATETSTVSGSSAAPGLSVPTQQYRDLSTLQPGERLYENYESLESYVLASKEPATRRAYNSDWRLFCAWCESHNLCSLPALPETVALYISYLADPKDGSAKRKPATIDRKITSINSKHKEAKLASPALMTHKVLAAALQGIRRKAGTAQTMKRPLTLECVLKILDCLEGPIAAPRDRALVLIGYGGGLRRSELAGIEVKHVKDNSEGMTILLPRSKTDSEGKGRLVEYSWGTKKETCPVTALQNWLAIAGIREGFVFRSVSRYGSIGPKLRSDTIGRLVQKLVAKAGIDNPEEYGGHSLRAGFVTEASANGATNDQIMKQTGHKSEAMVRRYSRADQEDKLKATRKLGL